MLMRPLALLEEQKGKRSSDTSILLQLAKAKDALMELASQVDGDGYSEGAGSGSGGGIGGGGGSRDAWHNTQFFMG